MLHSYSFENFQSFRDHVEVSMLLKHQAPRSGWEAVSPAGQRLSTVIGVIGANGAGKTALLKPLAFAAWFMRHSFASSPEGRIPVTPHFAHASGPTVIEVEAEDAEGVLWRYVLRLTPERVLHEALYKKVERFNYVFVRNWEEQTQSYVVKQQGFGFTPGEARKVRANASLVSTAAQYGVDVAQQLTQFTLATNIAVLGRQAFEYRQLQHAATLFSADEGLRRQMAALLAGWDLGLSDVLVRELDVLDQDGALIKRPFTFGVHRTRAGESIDLPMEDESSGTQSAYVLLSRLLGVLSKGGIALIDEIENDLHPHMLEPLLDLFANPQTNPHHAQLIFTSHSPQVLDLLDKAQVMFVEKDWCESLAYRGDEIKGLRSDDNIRAKYLAGALGAVPNFR